MSTITAILEADLDGSLHLPVPESLRRGKVRVTAVMEPLEEKESRSNAKIDAALGALRRLKKSGAFGEITDAVAWQREQRRDHSLAGRPV